MIFDMIVMGSASLDVFVKADAKIIQIEGTAHGHEVEEKLLAYPLGSKILIHQLGFYPGGAGTNVCATFAALGFKTAFVGMVGEDAHGLSLLQWLQDNGIAFRGQRHGETGYSLILASPAQDRTILSYKGSNNHFDAAYLPERLEARWVYGTSMLEESFHAQEALFMLAKRNGTRTAYNPNPYICSQGLGYLQKLLEHTDVLILNREEARLLVGAGEPLELAERLSERGPGIVTVSDGPQGATIFASAAWGGERWHIKPAPDLEIVETTGAGDAFGSGLVAGLNLAKSVREAALMGVLNAESVIQAYGAKNHIADRERMESRLLAERDSPRHEITRL